MRELNCDKNIDEVDYKKFTGHFSHYYQSYPGYIPN